MLMEIYLSEEKAKKNNIDLNECYQKIDKYFKSRGVEIVSKGIYKGVRKDFDTFAIAQGSLPDTNWFLKVVDQWYISYFGEEEEIKKSLTILSKKKEQLLLLLLLMIVI